MAEAERQEKKLIIVRPVCELHGRAERMEDVLKSTVKALKEEGVLITWVEMASELKRISLKGERVLFAICLSEAGVNMEYYRLLEYLRVFQGASGLPFGSRGRNHR